MARAGGPDSIRSLSVQGGFLDGLAMEFAPALNCIIGGEGTGKSTVLEFLRFALEQMPDPALSPDHHGAVESLVRSNLGTGVIKVGVDSSTGTPYDIERTQSDEESVVLDRARSPVEFDLAMGTASRAQFCSNDEIARIAASHGLQLRLIDGLAGQEVREAELIIESLRARLADNALTVARRRKEIGDRGGRLDEELADVEARLEALDEPESGSPPLREQGERKAFRVREQRAFEALLEFAAEHERGIGAAVEEILSEAPSIAEDILSGPNAELFLHLASLWKEKTRTATAGLREGAKQLGLFARELLDLKKSELDKKHSMEEAGYLALLRRHGKGRGLASKRDSLLRRRIERLDAKARRDRQSEKLARAEAERGSLVRELSDARDRRYAARARQAEEITSALAPTIRVAVEQFGDAEEYRGLLLRALGEGGGRREALVARITERIPPQELAARVRTADRERLKQALDVDDEQVNRLVLQLRDSPHVHDIETVELPDRVRIELKDGTGFRPSPELSTGQKCSAILPILLLVGEGPVLIYGPEDNLDSGFTRDQLVPAVRSAKGGRQFIFVTSDPAIPVLADAERVFVMESDGKQAGVRASGTVDETRAEIERVMEGAKEAFEMRERRDGR